jgi:sortase A
MPERGPVQLLLHFLRLRQAPGWKIGLAVALVAALGLLPGEGSLYHKAKTGLAQSLRQAAWKHALAGEPQPKPWPWDHASPAVYSAVPRLGLSAAVHYDVGDQRSEPALETSRRSFAQDARDPHLLGDVAIGDQITVTTADGSTRPYKVTGRRTVDPRTDDTLTLEPGAPPKAAAQPDSCSPSGSTLSGALHLIIEAIQGDREPTPPTTSDEQKL